MEKEIENIVDFNPRDKKYIDRNDCTHLNP